MIAMNCPSCGAEGRIPREKLNTRLLCKKCMESFHLTDDGKAHRGAPPARATPTPPPHLIPEAHALDHVEEEVAHWLDRLRRAVPWAVAALGLVVAATGATALYRASRPPGLEEQATRIARALIRGDAATLHELSLAGTSDAAAEWWVALRSEIAAHAPAPHAVEPSVELARSPAEPGPGLVEFATLIRTDQPVERKGFAVPDLSTEIRSAGSLEFPLVLAGADGSGWLLDGSRTLEAFRRTRPNALARAARP